jgi:uncharacterized membrane protein
MESKFKIVYIGKLKPGTDVEEFVGRFSRIFHVSVEKARRLVDSDKPVVLKKGLDSASADRFREKLEMIGMQVRIEPMPSEQSPLELSLAPREQAEDHKAEAVEGRAPSEDVQRCPKCGSRRIEDDSCLDCGIVLSKYRRIMQEREAQPAEDDDPYAAPRAKLVDEAETGAMTGPVTVPIGHGWSWLAEGFGYFRRNPLAWIGALLVWIGMIILANFIPVVGGLAINLLSGVIMAGFLLGIQVQERGGNFEVAHVFAGFSSNIGQLLLLGVIYLLGMLLVLAVMVLVVSGSVLMLGDMQAMEQNPELMMEMMGGPAGILLMVLAVLAVMIPLMMAYFFAPALIAIEGLSALSAMKYSFMGCLKNILPFFWYGLLGTGLMVLGMLPLGLGLLVVVPMFMASVYAAFRDIYYD